MSPFEALFLLLLFPILVTWDFGWWMMGITPLTPSRMKEVLRRTESNHLLLDVRSSREYRWFHIEGARQDARILWNPSRIHSYDPPGEILLVCLSGHRAPLAAYRLKRQGFHKVSYLAGGMFAWFLSGGPVLTGSDVSRE